MSVTSLRHCPADECQFNAYPVYADYEQIRRHLWEHNYKELLQTAMELNLIPEYVQPNKFSLVEYLAGLSKIESNQNA